MGFHIQIRVISHLKKKKKNSYAFHTVYTFTKYTCKYADKRRIYIHNYNLANNLTRTIKNQTKRSNTYTDDMPDG